MATTRPLPRALHRFRFVNTQESSVCLEKIGKFGLPLGFLGAAVFGRQVRVSAPSPASSATPSGPVRTALASVAFLGSAVAVVRVLRSARVGAVGTSGGRHRVCRRRSSPCFPDHCWSTTSAAPSLASASTNASTSTQLTGQHSALVNKVQSDG